MLRKLIFPLVVAFVLVSFPKPVGAIYDSLSVANNKFGIHVFDTSEVEKAAQFANSSGGEWGYITIPIRANERDLAKWTKFMVDCRRLKLIPILRIASFPSGENWMAPNEYDLVDFSNFLNDLPWPTKNRYVLVYNEPNHQGEWGGFVYPEEYARVLDRATDIFHKKNADFFVIAAGFDSSAPNSATSMDVYRYMEAMNAANPGVFARVDGLSFHAYGNPGFSSFPNSRSKVSIGSYKFELDFLFRRFGISEPKIFLTEAGWRVDLIGDTAARNFYHQAFESFWTEPNIVAITPFVLDAQAGPFEGFSFIGKGNQFKPFAKDLTEIKKTKGQPQLSDAKVDSSPTKPYQLPQGQSPATTVLGNFFHQVLNFLGLVKS